MVCFAFFAQRSFQVDAAEGINRQINFQGKLVNPDGTNVTDGTYTIVFSVYTVSTAGSAIWTETQTPTVTQGIFQVSLGSVTALPGSIDFNTDNIYLGIKVGADAEMAPRIRFTAVPQAFNSEKLGGLDKTGFIQNTTTQQPSSNFNISGIGVVGTSLTTPILQSAAATGLTITGNAASTWSTTAGNITIQAGSGTINLGTTTNLSAGGALAVNATNGALTLQTTGSGNIVINAAGILDVQDNATFAGSVGVATDLTVDTNTFFVDSANNRVGIGTLSPAAPLDVTGTAQNIANGTIVRVVGTLNSTSNNQAGLRVSPNIAPTSAVTGSPLFSALTMTADSSSSNLGTAGLAGVYGGMYYSGTGTVANAYGAYLQNQIVAAGTLTNSYGLYVDNPVRSAGTIGTNYGIYIKGQTQGSTNYALYSEGGANFFGGTLQFASLNCTTFTNGGALTTDASGNISCSNDDGGGAGSLQAAYDGSTSPATINQIHGKGIVINGAQPANQALTNGTNATTALAVTAGQGGNSSFLGATAGNGGALSFTSGAGGNSTGGGASVGGNGGTITVQTGAGGTGATNGVYGALNLQTTGGSTTIGNTAANYSVTLRAGTGGVSIANGGVANTIQIGNTTGAVAQTINIGNNATASSTSTVTIGSTIGTSTTTIRAGSGGIVGTGTLNVSGATTLQSTLAVQGASVTVGAAALQGNLILHDGNGGQTASIRLDNIAANTVLTLPATLGATDTFCFVALNNCVGQGVTTIGAYSTTNTAANGATISGAEIIFQSASASAPGMVSTGTQTFGGAKTFNSSLTVATDLTVDTNTLFVDAANNRVGIGTTAPTQPLHIVREGNHSRIYLDTFGDSTVESNVTGWHARGTAASPTATQTSDVLMAVRGGGYGTTGFGSTTGAMILQATENWTDTAQGTRTLFNVTATGTVTNLRVLALEDSAVTVGSVVTDALAIRLVLDSYNNAADPTGQNGSMYYNTANNKFRCYQNSVWTDCIIAADGGVTTVGTFSTTNTAANGATITGTDIIFQSASASAPGMVDTGSQTFAGAKTFNASVTIAANQTLNLAGGTTASRPASPTEGMVYFDTTTKTLLTYANGKWQATTGEYLIVAASNSTQAIKDAAHYVADGDNVTGAGTIDGDQVQINAALTAASGGKVYLAAGTYVADATILIPNNTTLAGAGRGTLIEMADIDITDNLIENTDQLTGTGIVVRDLRIDGRKDLNTIGSQVGMYLTEMGDTVAGRKGAVIEKVEVANFRGFGIRLQSSENNIVTASDVNGSVNSGIYLNGSSNNQVTGNISRSNAEVGILVYNGSSYNTVSGNQAASNTLDGIFVWQTSVGNTVSGNTASANGQSGFRLYGAENNTVSGNTSRGNTTRGISLENSANNNTITGNTAEGNTTYGISFVNSSNNNVANGNKINNSGGSTTNNGIYIETSDSNTFTGNSISDSSATTNNFAVNIFNSTSDTNYLADNTLGSGSINDAGTGTVYGGQINSSNQIQQTASAGVLVKSGSATAFQVQNAAGNEILKVDTMTNNIHVGKASSITGKLVMHNSSNANTVTLTTGVTTTSYNLVLPTSAGSAGQCLKNGATPGELTFGECAPAAGAKRLRLHAEYPNSVIQGSGTNNTGTMTSEVNYTDRMSYFKWTTAEATNQSYDVITQVPIPNDFGSWASSTPIKISTRTSNTTNGTITMELRDSANAVICNFVAVTPSTTNTWEETGSLCNMSTGTYTAGNYMTVTIRMQSPTSGDVRIGNIYMDYTPN